MISEFGVLIFDYLVPGNCTTSNTCCVAPLYIISPGNAVLGTFVNLIYCHYFSEASITPCSQCQRTVFHFAAISGLFCGLQTNFSAFLSSIHNVLEKTQRPEISSISGFCKYIKCSIVVYLHCCKSFGTIV